MELGLHGGRVLITGASSGIGAATARLLAEEGMDVIIGFYQNRTGAETSAATVRAAGRSAWLWACDISDPAAVQAAFQALPAAALPLDVIVLNAGLNVITPFEQVSVEEWERVIRVNLNGPFYVIQAALPHLAENAAIVTVASVAAHTGAPHHPHYAAAKAGLINLTKSLARTLGPRARVNCVAPGITLTPMGADTAASLPPEYAHEKLLTGRYAESQEIARCIAFLASPLNGFIAGATLDVNGGRILR